VFGEVVRGKSVVRQIENHPTSNGDVPTEPIVIANCGQLDPSDPSLTQEAAAVDGDPYEDFPDDEDKFNVGESEEEALKAAQAIREAGNALFKAGKFDDALAKYEKSVRYLDIHYVGAEGDAKKAHDTLLAPVLLNGALAAIKLKSAAYARRAVSLTDRALNIPTLSTADRAKGLYRRGLANVALNDEESAEKNLTEATALVPDDQAIKAELNRIKESRKTKREAEKKKFKKMFG
jgi:peptidyl-prolyl isomerase D